MNQLRDDYQAGKIKNIRSAYCSGFEGFTGQIDASLFEDSELVLLSQKFGIEINKHWINPSHVFDEHDSMLGYSMNDSWKICNDCKWKHIHTDHIIGYVESQKHIAQDPKQQQTVKENLEYVPISSQKPPWADDGKSISELYEYAKQKLLNSSKVCNWCENSFSFKLISECTIAFESDRKILECDDCHKLRSDVIDGKVNGDPKIRELRQRHTQLKIRRSNLDRSRRNAMDAKQNAKSISVLDQVTNMNPYFVTDPQKQHNLNSSINRYDDLLNETSEIDSQISELETQIHELKIKLTRKYFSIVKESGIEFLKSSSATNFGQLVEKESTKNTGNSQEPLMILKMRLAKGEITKKEFEELKAVIEK